MPNLGNRTVGQDPSAANVRDPQQKGDEIHRSRGQDEHGKKAAQADFRDPIVTEITPASTYYEAKGAHQDYYRNNRQAGYCRAVIAPKLDKLGLKK